MRYFLLMAGHNYYPCGGTEVWVRCYDTRESAEADIKDISKEDYPQYKIDGIEYDWYEIIDLRDWINVSTT